MSNATRWVGIDLHRNRSHVAVIDEQGELTVSRRIVNDRDTFLELLGDPQDAETHVALEATYGWEWLAELLEEAGYDPAPRAPTQDQGDRGGAGEDRRDRRQDARAPVAHRLSRLGLPRCAS